jgi:hypothetical protein
VLLRDMAKVSDPLVPCLKLYVPYVPLNVLHLWQLIPA